MNLEEHLDWAQTECEFIGELLHNEGIQNVLGSCIELGSERLREFAEDHQAQIAMFFHTPPEARGALLEQFEEDFEEDEGRHAFLLAALHTARSALFLHECLYKSGVTRAPDAGKSRLFLEFAEASQLMRDGHPSLYPFAEDLPFGMNLEWFGLEEEQAEGQGGKPSARRSLGRSQGSKTRKPSDGE